MGIKPARKAIGWRPGGSLPRIRLASGGDPRYLLGLPLPGIRLMSVRLCTGAPFLRLDRSGATSIEYALIGAFISIMIVAWATAIGSSVSDFFTQVANGF